MPDEEREEPVTAASLGEPGSHGARDVEKALARGLDDDAPERLAQREIEAGAQSGVPLLSVSISFIFSRNFFSIRWT